MSRKVHLDLGGHGTPVCNVKAQIAKSTKPDTIREASTRPELVTCENCLRDPLFTLSRIARALERIADQGDEEE